MLGVSNQLTDATGVSAGAKHWQGGQGIFACSGTFAGATVKLQWQLPDGVTWVDAGTYCTLTAAGGGLFTLARGPIQVVISGGAPTGLNATAVRVAL